MAEQCLRIEGGARLQGQVAIAGAKNAALPAIAACLLTGDECLLENVPDIGDIHIMAEVLRSLGATVEEAGTGRLRIRAHHISAFAAPSDLVRKTRASFLVMGPLLARFGQAISCPPGGDVIGQRPIDVHLVGFIALGAAVHRHGEDYHAHCPRLRGTKIFMDYPSHIGTENLIMAATLAQGTTIVQNASSEPEIVCLAEMLNSMGAKIRGAGTSTIEIEGVDELHGTRHHIIPDRIEAGTYAIAGALTGGEVELSPVMPDHMDSLLWKLNEVGVHVRAMESSIVVSSSGKLQAVNVQALPYPGFATDLQAGFGVLLTQATGTSVIHERVYDNRLLYFQELRKMGADVAVDGQTAVIQGPLRLHGAMVRALDIRSGAALALAGLVADGTTEVVDIYHLDRGYERFDDKLRALGANISRSSVATASASSE